MPSMAPDQEDGGIPPSVPPPAINPFPRPHISATRLASPRPGWIRQSDLINTLSCAVPLAGLVVPGVDPSARGLTDGFSGRGPVPPVISIPPFPPHPRLVLRQDRCTSKYYDEGCSRRMLPSLIGTTCSGGEGEEEPVDGPREPLLWFA